MRDVVLALGESRIHEVANEGMGRDDVLRFWFGESDEVTPAFVREAAIASLQTGDTFYAHNLGLPELRAWGWRRAAPSAPRRQAGCAGASPVATRSDLCKGGGAPARLPQRAGTREPGVANASAILLGCR